MTEILALTGARANSDRFPNKSLSVVGGKTLIQIAAEACKGSRYVDRMIFSAPYTDTDYMNEAIAHGYEPFWREPSSANPGTTQWMSNADTLRVLIQQGYELDIVVQVQACNPFSRSEHIDQVIDKYLEGNCGMALTVVHATPNPYTAWVDSTDGTLQRPTINGIQWGRNALSMPRAYWDAGTAKACHPNKMTTTEGDAPYDWAAFVVLTSEDALDINTPLDLEQARAIYEKRQQEVLVA